MGQRLKPGVWPKENLRRLWQRTKALMEMGHADRATAESGKEDEPNPVQGRTSIPDTEDEIPEGEEKSPAVKRKEPMAEDEHPLNIRASLTAQRSLDLPKRPCIKGAIRPDCVVSRSVIVEST